MTNIAPEAIMEMNLLHCNKHDKNSKRIFIVDLDFLKRAFSWIDKLELSRSTIRFHGP